MIWIFKAHLIKLLNYLQGSVHEDHHCDTFMHRINISEATEKICEEFKHKILSHQLLGAARFTYPFLIEFALIGASVAYIMSNHIGKRQVLLLKV